MAVCCKIEPIKRKRPDAIDAVAVTGWVMARMVFFLIERSTDKSDIPIASEADTARWSYFGEPCKI
jgi:hypothetical protein